MEHRRVAPATATAAAATVVGDHEGQQDGHAREQAEEGGSEEETEPLPVTLFKDQLMEAVRANRVLVCTGETGSGKTTQIPQYLLELVREGDDANTTTTKAGVENNDDKGKDEERIVTPAASSSADNEKKKERARANRKLLVAVTQPRRVAATSVARRVADERGCRLGEEVGYSIRFEDRTGPRTRIKYMTDGVLVRECLEDPHLSRYGVVMLDEAHERSIDTDILFGLLKRALAHRSDLRAVITSATLDVERFAAFFGGCPFISVPGRTHAVDVYHSKTRQVTQNVEALPSNHSWSYRVLDGWLLLSSWCVFLVVGFHQNHCCFCESGLLLGRIHIIADHQPAQIYAYHRHLSRSLDRNVPPRVDNAVEFVFDGCCDCQEDHRTARNVPFTALSRSIPRTGDDRHRPSVAALRGGRRGHHPQGTPNSGARARAVVFHGTGRDRAGSSPAFGGRGAGKGGPSRHRHR